MRILVVEPGPNFSVADVSRGWTKALSKVATVETFDLGLRMGWYERALQKTVKDDQRRLYDTADLVAEDLAGTCMRFWPDVVIVVSAFFLRPATYKLLRARHIKIVALMTESPYEDPAQSLISHDVDLTVLNDPTNIELFDNAIYIPHAYDPDIHKPGTVAEQYRSDFCFVGTAYESRIKFFEQVNWTGIDVALAGNWEPLDEDSPLRKFVAHDINECVDNEEAVKLYQGAKCSANLYRTEAAADDFSQGWAMGPREVELAATGCFYLTQARGENREVLPMVPTFEDPIDLSEQLRWWLAHDDARISVAEKAREAIADRTFDAHAATLLRHLGL